MSSTLANPAADPMPSGLPAPNALQALLDATVDGVVIIDEAGTIETFNRSAERLFGYTRAEAVGRNVRLLMTERDESDHDAYIARYVRTGVAHVIGIGREVVARRKDGTEFPVHLSIGRIDGTNPPRFVGLLHDITLRRENMLALQRQRDRARLYLNVAQVVIVVLDARGRVLLINRRGCELLVRSETELVGASWLDIAVSPLDRERVAAGMRGQLEGDRATEREYRVESRVRTSTGEDRLIDWNVIAVPDPSAGTLILICSGDDITERRAAEDSVRQLRALLDEAQAVAHIGNYVVGWPEATRDYWSPEVYRIFGFDPAEGRLTAAALGQRVHPEDLPGLRATYRQRAAQLGVFESAFRIVLPGGEVRHVHTKYQIEKTAEGALRVLGTVIDATEGVRAAEEARLSQQRMAHVSNLATMGEMAAGFAHEINQPLAAIANFAQASRRLLGLPEPELDDVRGALQQIAEQALRAGEIIRRMRSLVRRQATQRERVSLCELFDDVVGFCAHDAHMHQVRVRLHCEPGMPDLAVDRIQMQQVVLNLLRNAIDAVKNGPEEDREIAIHCARGDGECRIEVRDRGPGVPPEIVGRIFEPFVTTKADGTGLGLAISRSIVQAHRGGLTYRANEPSGACFQITLPIDSGRPK